MKLKNGFILREVAGSTVVVSLDPEHTFGSMLKLNGTGKLLWERLSEESTVSSLTAALTAEYEIDEGTAQGDVERFLDMLRSFGVLEE